MDFRQKLGAGAIAACAIIGIVTFAFWPRAEAEIVAEEPAASYGTATIAPNAPGDSTEVTTSTPEPSAVPDPNDPAATDSNHVDYISTGPNKNLNTHFTAANAAVLAYATVNPEETVEARSARLAPYFAPGSELLTQEPDLVNPRNFNNMTTTIVARGVPMAGFESEEDGMYRLKVLLDYTATYVQSGKPMEVLATGVWHVTMSTTFDGLVLSVEEPDGR